MSGRKEFPEDFLLLFGFIGVSDSNSGLEDRRRSIIDSFMVLNGHILLPWKCGNSMRTCHIRYALGMSVSVVFVPGMKIL